MRIRSEESRGHGGLAHPLRPAAIVLIMNDSCIRLSAYSITNV